MSRSAYRAALLVLAFTLDPFVAAPAVAQSSPAIAEGASDTAFVLARPGVIPENIVYDEPSDRSLGGDLERDGERPPRSALGRGLHPPAPAGR